MLDQNTDRMWYVIGAVIIGAAIILILNNTFPQLFASVGETFGNKVDDTALIVNDIGKKQPGGGEATDGVGPLDPNTVENTGFNMRSLEIWQSSKYNWSSDTSMMFNANPANYQGGVKIPSKYFTAGEKYTVAFDIQLVSGELQGLGGHVHMSSAVDVTIDGAVPELWDKGYNSMGLNRWSSTVVYPNDKAKHRVEVTFTKSIDNPTIDNNFYIQPNRAGDKAKGYFYNALAYEVLLENVAIYQHK